MRIVLLIVIFPVLLSAQNKTADSLKFALKNAKQDTLRAGLLIELSRQMFTINPDTSVLLSEQALSLIEKESISFPMVTHVQRVRAGALSDLGYLYNLDGKIDEALGLYNRNIKVLSEVKMPDGNKGDYAMIATTLSTMALIYHQQGKPTEALQYFNRCLKIREKLKMPDGKIGDKIGIAQSLSNIATIYNFQGLIKEAIEYNNRSLKIKEELGDENGTATSLNNIGYIYYKQEQYQEAMSFYLRSLKIYEKLGNKLGVASALNNIGGIYKAQKKLTEALDYYTRSIKINDAAGNKQVVAASYNNIGLIYSDMGDFKSALENYTRALNYYEEMKERKGLSNTLCNIGYVYKKQNKLKDAFASGSKSLEYAQQVGFIESIERSAKLMSEIYELQGNGMQALKMHKLFILMRDSARGKENQKALFTREAKYEYEKRAAADSIKNADEKKVKDAQLQAQNASLKSEKTQRYALYGGLILVAGFLIFVFNRFRVTNKQKKIIEEQKTQVDAAFEKLHEKNKEVLDSIHYAKRIQSALMPNEKYIDRKLQEFKS